FYRIAADREDYWNGRSRPFCCHRRRGSARGDHPYPTMSQIGSHYRQLIIATLSPTKFNRYTLTFDIAKFTQALAERLQAPHVWVGRSVVEETDHRLLRPRRERPCRRATNKRDEPAPPHVFPSGRRLNPTTPSERLCITANSGGQCLLWVKSGHSALRQRTSLFDHLVGGREQRRRHGRGDRPGSLEVNG